VSLVQLAEAPQVGHVPDGLEVGRPIRVLSPGPIFSRFSGKRLATVTEADLVSMAALFEARSAPRPDGSEPDPVILDWNHASASPTPLPPETSMALGRVVALTVESGALYAVPAYTPRGVRVVEDSAGALWPSPEWATGKVAARESGKRVGRVQLLALTLTPRPQQTADRIDPVQLTEARPGGMEDSMAEKKAAEQEAAGMDVQAEIEGLKASIEAIMEILEEMKAPATEEAAESCEEPTKAASETLAIQFGERVARLEAEAKSHRFASTFAALAAEGKVAKAERENALAVFQLSEAGSIGATPGVQGSGSKPEPEPEGPKNRTELDDAVRALMSEKGITDYNVADKMFRDANPEAWERAVAVEG
jgi:hypothetical protein